MAYAATGPARPTPLRVRATAARSPRTPSP